ncbi:hypothetical protein B0J17DRAFT_721980 [Rhizoctonia solani]|nr:hypothetical protein B0J17DRAFT_721980 [Rhizoctonia solani]
MAVEPAFDLLVLCNYTNDAATFHFRSLRTGLPHSNASLPTLLYTGDSDSGLEADFEKVQVEIFGRRIAYMREFAEPQPLDTIVTIFDWVSGQLITSTRTYRNSFSFLSEDVFILADLESTAKPLKLYTLSEFNNERLRWVEFEFLPSSQLSVWHGDLAVTPPPLVYDLCPTSHYLSLRICLLALANTLDAQSNNDIIEVPWLE